MRAVCLARLQGSLTMGSKLDPTNANHLNRNHRATLRKMILSPNGTADKVHPATRNALVIRGYARPIGSIIAITDAGRAAYRRLDDPTPIG